LLPKEKIVKWRGGGKIHRPNSGTALESPKIGGEGNKYQQRGVYWHRIWNELIGRHQKEWEEEKRA